MDTCPGCAHSALRDRVKIRNIDRLAVSRRVHWCQNIKPL